MEPRQYDLKLDMTGTIKETPNEYAAYLHHYISYSRALMSAARMLRKSPSALWATYPDYFPDPNEEGGDEKV